ncbi:MAG: ComEA family DNA-binding protein [Ezakiella sp.]|uniref:ComEA family DNA-binding protein n=1 Tax=Ezakiella sp. TaxID=1935205 RepID=UPI002A9148D3|nr:ComEA family DNA-binding protein [Ezakiella sp.]MDY6080085.1 ComEA family DNA-binding protein [Ezakiella sp.]
MKKKFIYLAIIFIFSITGCKDNSEELLRFKMSEDELEQEDTIEEKSEKKDELLIVHVSGSVKRAGVYQLEKDKRIIDAIEKAGGMLEEADSDVLNLAEKIKDGMKIYVPKKGEKPTTSTNLKSQSYIDLNLAEKEELMTLPGVGEKTADKIIAYREAQPFEKVDDLLKVSGFGKKKMEALKGLIAVGGEIYE